MRNVKPQPSGTIKEATRNVAVECFVVLFLPVVRNRKKWNFFTICWFDACKSKRDAHRWLTHRATAAYGWGKLYDQTGISASCQQWDYQVRAVSSFLCLFVSECVFGRVSEESKVIRLQRSIYRFNGRLSSLIHINWKRQIHGRLGTTFNSIIQLCFFAINFWCL